MKILVTGSNGFIGKWLTNHLSYLGHDVYGSEDVNLLEAGVFASLLVSVKPDLVYHLAAQVGRVFGEADVSHTVRSNAELTAVVAKCCSEQNIRLAYVSTSEVYGDHGEDECYESGKLLLPHNLYGLTKRWGEEAAQLFAPEKLIIARLSMPYGPGAPPGYGRRAMDTMLWQAHHGLPINVHANSERSWCWVGDTVAALAILIKQDEGGIYNIGRDDDKRTMLQIAEMACDVSGASRELIKIIPAPTMQTVIKRLSCDKIRSLGWAPTVELEEGIKKVYDWVKTFPKNIN